MRWEGRRESGNVEDRRGRRVAQGAGVGLIGVLAVVGLSLLTGQDLTPLLDILNDGGAAPMEGPAPQGPPADALGRFASVVLADTEDTWTKLFASGGRSYAPPTLVLFTGRVASACGGASSAVGPFYCPADAKVYIDLSFFEELDRRFGAPGDFARAYVLAHEVGHHVQNLLGLSEKAARAERGASRREANQVSVRVELQADCLAGVWAHHAHKDRQLLEPGDVEEGLAAAAAIGDDRLQQLGQGEVQPESWTHGSSAQRVEWFRRGVESGDPQACDTF